MGDGADDVINLGICPICEETLKLSFPDALNFKGQIIHAKCAAILQAVAGEQERSACQPLLVGTENSI